ncbi:MAG: hydrolase [Candidatus Arcticimaribacter sp.]
MKTKIFIYLFAFTALILVFQLVNSSKVVKYQAETIAEKVARIDTLKVALDKVESKYAEDVYFSLDQNEEAQAFYPDEDPAVIIELVKEKLYESNTIKGDNPLVLYSGAGKKFLINKIKVLNHKWVIADFSDGTDWGEILIEYQIRGGEIKLNVLDQLLYYND